MSRTKFREVAWGGLVPVRGSWKLTTLSDHDPPAWDAFWYDERKYWGADAPDKHRFHSFFGNDNAEEHFLRSCKQKYEDLKLYMHLWNGLCKRSELVQVIEIDPSVIVLSRNWMGAVSDHSDLELVLQEERALFGRHVRYCCDVYSFGTRVVPKGSIEAQMGEPVGSFRVSHRRATQETVVFSPRTNSVSIRDATFEVLAGYA